MTRGSPRRYAPAMRSLAILAVSALSLFAASCGCCRTQPEPIVSQPAAPASSSRLDAAGTPRQDPEQVAKTRKQLEAKQRELARGELENRIADLDRQSKEMGAKREVESAEQALEVARRELDTFVKATRPREIEERQISLDRTIHRAEHSKEELAELEAMYEEDEFARNTKELVLKRGRRDAEMAERQLAVARQEIEEFEKHSLPAREAKLRRAVADAEGAFEKARLNLEKTRLEIELSMRKVADQRLELEQEVAELERKLGESVR